MPNQDNTKKPINAQVQNKGTGMAKPTNAQMQNKGTGMAKPTSAQMQNKGTGMAKSTSAQVQNKGIGMTKPTNIGTNRLSDIDGSTSNKQLNNIKPRSQRDKEPQKNINEKNNKKGNNIIGILFIVLVLFIAIGVFGFSILKSDGTSAYFNDEDKVGAQALYDNVMSISQENYPNTPEEVVKAYTEAYRLLYGDKIKDLSIVPNILDKQRILLSDDLLANNPFEEQVNQVLYSIENLKNNKVKITSIDVKPTNYDQKNSTLAYVKVDKIDSLFQTYYYIYHLKLENGKWKITGWYNTDENYNIIEQ